MKKERPTTSTWYVKLILVLLISGVIYITVKSFISGYNEGRMHKHNKENR